MPDLSLIVPVHNERDRLPVMMERLFRAVDTAPCDLEILLIENGSTDETAFLANLYAECNPRMVRAVSLPMRGKGAAVRYGMLDSQAPWRMMIDCDLAVSIDQLWEMYAQRWKAPVVIASREIKGARRRGEPPHRRLMSWAFARLVQALALPCISDSQCGFKLFNEVAASRIFPQQTMAGMAFDVEILFLAGLEGLKVLEVPVTWWNDGNSQVHPLGDALSMFRDLLAIRRNYRAGIYDWVPRSAERPRISPAQRSPGD